MPPPIWILGAGGLGREALDACRRAGVDVAGFVDHHARGPVGGLTVEASVPDGSSALVAIGDSSTRARVSADVSSPAEPVVHPTAVIADGVSLHPGVLVLAGAVVSVEAVLAAHTQVHYNATVGHDTRLGRWCTVLPGANVAGSVEVGERVLIGSGAVVLQGLRIGDGATVGAGAVVTRDVAPGSTVVGIPARSI